MRQFYIKAITFCSAAAKESGIIKLGPRVAQWVEADDEFLDWKMRAAQGY